jgi:hypothetical protein
MRLLIAIVALAVPVVAQAEWVFVSKSDKINYYLDPSSVEIDWGFRRVWQLQDLVQPEEGVRSRRFLAEYECPQKRWRVLQISSHTEPMATGNPVVSGPQSREWEFIVPNTPGEAMFKMVCSR